MVPSISGQKLLKIWFHKKILYFKKKYFKAMFFLNIYIFEEKSAYLIVENSQIDEIDLSTIQII